MRSLYHIYIVPQGGVTQEQVEQKLNLAVHWYRYNQGNYVVYTTSDAAKWFERLNQFVDPGGWLFICKFDPSDNQGWMRQDFWDWLNSKKVDS